ncbi:MAG: phospholipid carrier-dependent glycosyltransferase [Hydrococcus sp. CRU_1_1]|nr:phospholipid carrier-dependent glycosyltransferase [Hydrococcus sp. CRU_1_1]
MSATISNSQRNHLMRRPSRPAARPGSRPYHRSGIRATRRHARLQDERPPRAKRERTGVRLTTERPISNRDRNLGDTLKIIAEDVHPPLYYLMTRFWVQWFGNSVAVIRSLAAIFSILTLPLMYWLCLELFKSPLTGWVATALMPVSPFHVLYAQESRQYSFLTLVIVFASLDIDLCYPCHYFP